MGEVTQLLATAALQEGVYFTRRPARLTQAGVFRSLAVVGEIPKYVIPDPLSTFRFCGNSTYTETKNKIRRLNLGQHPRLKKFDMYFNYHF